MDRGFMIQIPAALDYALKDTRYNWGYYTDPEPFMNNRRMYCPRGRVLGGSSSINGMMFVRGHFEDFDGWAKDDGLTNWSYAHCLPYFKRMESYDRGVDAYRGDSGPLHISTAKPERLLDRAFLDAARQAGYQHSDDTNGYQHEGFGVTDRNIFKGRRWSAADAYLHPVSHQSNLRLFVEANVQKILFDGKRAIGAEFFMNGQVHRVYGEREILLASGSINSPQLLMLSGIGHAEHLGDHDIPLVQHLPGVGENLQDHLDLRVQVASTKPVSLYSDSKGIRRLMVGIQWLLTKRGVCSTNLLEVAGYIRSNPEILYPDLQLTFMAIAASYDGSHSYHGHGYQALFDLMRPASRGRIRLKSRDPSVPPSILFRYLEMEADQRVVVNGLRLAREILGQQAFSAYRGQELSPGPEVKNDDDVLAWARATGETEYHPTSSCSMGCGDNAVVDSELKVHGIDGLRVVDASVMPKIVTANTNAATIMIAEKAADIIKGEEILQPEFPITFKSM